MAEWSKAVDSGSIPKGRGFKSRLLHFYYQITDIKHQQGQFNKNEAVLTVSTVILFFLEEGMKQRLTCFYPFPWVLTDQLVNEILCLLRHSLREQEHLILHLHRPKFTLSIFFIVSFLLM